MTDAEFFVLASLSNGYATAPLSTAGLADLVRESTREEIREYEDKI
jgi:hypothetical protein